MNESQLLVIQIKTDMVIWHMSNAESKGAAQPHVQWWDPVEQYLIGIQKTWGMLICDIWGILMCDMRHSDMSQEAFSYGVATISRMD